MLTEENKELYESYFQNNADYYVNQIKKHDESGKYSFSVPAFFLGFFWLAYRKMYLHILIIFVLIIIEFFIEETLYEYDLISLDTYQIIDIVSRFAWSSAIGFLASRLYITKSQKVVNKIMEEHIDREQRMQALTKKGGTSILAPIVIIAIFVIVFMLVSYASVGYI